MEVVTLADWTALNSFVLRLKTVTVPKNKAQNHSHSDRQYITDRSSIEALSSANAAGRIQREHMREELSPQEVVDNTIALQSGQGIRCISHNLFLGIVSLSGMVEQWLVPQHHTKKVLGPGFERPLL